MFQPALDILARLCVCGEAQALCLGVDVCTSVRMFVPLVLYAPAWLCGLRSLLEHGCSLHPVKTDRQIDRQTDFVAAGPCPSCLIHWQGKMFPRSWGLDTRFLPSPGLSIGQYSPQARWEARSQVGPRIDSPRDSWPRRDLPLPPPCTCRAPRPKFQVRWDPWAQDHLARLPVSHST